MALRSSAFSLNELQEEETTVIDDNGGETVEIQQEFDDSEIEAPAETDVVEEAIENVAEIGEGLESIKDRLQVALANGGLTAGEAGWAQEAITTKVEKWFVLGNMPAVESFEGAAGRMSQTGYMIESVGSYIKGIWEKIKAFITKWLTRLDGFWAKHLSNAGRLKKSAEALIKKVDKASGSPEKPTLEISQTQYKNMLYKGKIDDVAQGLKNAVAIVDGLTSSSPAAKLLEDQAEMLEKLNLTSKEEVGSSNLKTLDLAKAVSIFSSVSKGLGWKASSDSRWKDGEGARYLVSDEIVGNKIALARFNGDEKGLRSIAVGLKDHSDAKFQEKYKVPSLKPSEINVLLGAVVTAADGVVSAKADLRSRKALVNKLVAQSDRLVKELESVKAEVENKEHVKAVESWIKGTGQASISAMQPDMDIHRQVVASAKAAYSYAVTSYNNLKSK